MKNPAAITALQLIVMRINLLPFALLLSSQSRQVPGLLQA
jgi:hypothetical protein